MIFGIFFIRLSLSSASNYQSVKTDGLVHISKLANRFVSDPGEVVKPHQHVKVKVLEVDIARKQIAFSMKKAE